MTSHVRSKADWAQWNYIWLTWRKLKPSALAHTEAWWETPPHAILPQNEKVMCKISAKLCQKKKLFGERDFASGFRSLETCLIPFFKEMNKQWRVKSDKIKLYISSMFSWKIWHVSGLILIPCISQNLSCAAFHWKLASLFQICFL